MSIIAKTNINTSQMSASNIAERKQHKEECEKQDGDIYLEFGELLVIKMKLFDSIFSDNLYDYEISREQ
jgi:hypothetical protein